MAIFYLLVILSHILQKLKILSVCLKEIFQRTHAGLSCFPLCIAPAHNRHWWAFCFNRKGKMKCYFSLGSVKGNTIKNTCSLANFFPLFFLQLYLLWCTSVPECVPLAFMPWQTSPTRGRFMTHVPLHFWRGGKVFIKDEASFTCHHRWHSDSLQARMKVEWVSQGWWVLSWLYRSRGDKHLLSRRSPHCSGWKVEQ